MSVVGDGTGFMIVDFGFERTFSSGKCISVLNPEEKEQYIKEQCMDVGNNGNYEVSKGYRLIPSDSCINPLPQYQWRVGFTLPLKISTFVEGLSHVHNNY